MAKIAYFQKYSNRKKDNLKFEFNDKQYNLEIDFNFGNQRISILSYGALLLDFNINYKTDNFHSFKIDDLEGGIFIRNIADGVEYDIFINQISIINGKYIEAAISEMKARGKKRKIIEKAMIMFLILSGILILFTAKTALTSDFYYDSTDSLSRLVIAMSISLLISFVFMIASKIFDIKIKIEEKRYKNNIL
jgi:hypothetical protein